MEVNHTSYLVKKYVADLDQEKNYQKRLNLKNENAVIRC